MLALTVTRTFERSGALFAVSLRGGTIPVLLTQDDGAHGLDRMTGAGLSLRLTTRQNIDALATHIIAKGVSLDTEAMDMRGVRLFRVRDPDGFLLVISSEQSEQ